jgi:sulfite reductase beta subunit-like hemoprotein
MKQDDIATARAAHRANMLAIKTDLDQVESALDQIDVSASSSYATNIAACTGATKTALQDTRKVLVDVKAALKNLRQAAEKVRKEIR